MMFSYFGSMGHFPSGHYPHPLSPNIPIDSHLIVEILLSLFLTLTRILSLTVTLYH